MPCGKQAALTELSRDGVLRNKSYNVNERAHLKEHESHEEVTCISAIDT